MREAVTTDQAPRPLGPYSQAIVAGDFIFLAGQGPGRPGEAREAETLGGVAEQTERTLANVRAVLEAAGSSLDKVVRCNVYLRDIGDFAAMNAVYARAFREPYPARTTIQAGALPGGIAVEIECTARR
jgi:2-iminobutanoate/2-iminopropanoate deaminase